MDSRTDPIYDVVIAGCGPTGALLAAELRLHGARVLVLERGTEPPAEVRIVSLHVRSLEMLDMRGLLAGLLPLGRRRPAGGLFAGIPSPPPELDTAHGYMLGIPQAATVGVLEAHAVELGAQVRHGQAVAGVEQDGDGVTVETSDGGRFRSRWLVACDGARSVVRKHLGVAFPGEASRSETLMGELALTASGEEIAAAVARGGARHASVLIRPAGEGRYRVVVPAVGLAGRAQEPALEDFGAAMRAVLGTDLGAHAPGWLSRFGDATRLVESYRVGRVLLAGDAAHIHPPAGGQGLNLGLQDAFNLGWKLGAQVSGWAREGLLDTYGSERRPVAAAVLENTRAQVALSSREQGAQAMRLLLTELLEVDEVNRRLTEQIAALDIRYESGDGHDLLGRRLRDVETSQGHLYGLLRSGRGLLLDRTGRLNVGEWTDRIDHLADLGAAVDVPALLLRPDGYIAWVGEEQEGLEQSLRRWFGAPLA